MTRSASKNAVFFTSQFYIKLLFINELVHFDKISKDNFRGGVDVDKNNEANFILNYAQSLLSWHLIQSITFFTLKRKEVVDAGGLFIGAVITRFESVVTFPGTGINTLFFSEEERAVFS
ncbi:hypothetical protein PGO02_18765 [Klebsiella aerogenes]